MKRDEKRIGGNRRHAHADGGKNTGKTGREKMS